jgi:hypothetical protein
VTNVGYRKFESYVKIGFEPEYFGYFFPSKFMIFTVLNFMQEKIYKNIPEPGVEPAPSNDEAEQSSTAPP